jgi:hypothetical protein
MVTFLVFLYAAIGLLLVAVSLASRTERSPFRDDAGGATWRFKFFAGWTLFLPVVWLFDWWGWELTEGFGGNARKPPAEIAVPHFAYGRKVVSDLWAAVAVVLAALAWNKPGGA